MINFDLDTIGGTFSKIRGAVSTSVSKWEKSFFGGFYQIVVDYPQVKIDDNIELSPAASPMGYFEKEKVLKIFLSQVKELNALAHLVRCAKTTKAINPLTGETVIKTTISNKGKIDALDILTGNDDYEYTPLFEHYKKFILDSEISFSKTFPGAGNSDSNSNGKNENGENGNDSKKNSDKNKNDKNDKKSNGSDGSGDKKKNNKGDKKKNKNENKKDSSSGDNKKSKSKTKINYELELERNSENMMNALKNTVEKKIKFLSLTASDNQMDICYG